MAQLQGLNAVRIGIILLLALLMGAPTGQAAHLTDITADPAVLLYAETDSGLWPREMTRIFADGSSGTTPFRVPARKVLVVTDVTWTFEQGFDHQVTVGLFIVNLQDSQKEQYGPFAGFTFEPTFSGAKSITQTFSTGFVVSEQAKIYPFTKSGGGSGQGFLGQGHVWVMGYLRAAP